MTTPGHEGEAFIEVHADTSEFPGEAERGIKRGAEQVEDDLEDVGDKWGETLTDAMGDRIEKEGPQLARSLERGLDRQRITVKTRIVYDADGNAIKRFVDTTTTLLTKELTDAFSDAGSSSGFGRIGQAFSDAIGAGFNISGRSPLIGFLVPVLGAIVGLIGAAIQAVNALVAVFLTLPGILASVGFQVGILAVAFQGVGTAVAGAFAARNAKELKLALEGLAPAAQAFVKSLLPIKDFFYQLRFTTQQNFFKFLGDDLIPQLLKFQGNRILGGFQEVAKALGTAFRELGFFFNSDTFAKFLDEIFPRTITFLEQFGPSFVTFLEGLINLANSAMPFMTEVGGIVSMVFKQLGDFLTETANDPAFLEWLAEMRDTLDEVVTFVKVAFVFIGALMDSLNQAGGENLITQLSLSLAMIADFLSSDVGISAMKAFINIAILSIQTITGLIIAILAIAGAAQKVWEILTQELLPAIGGFFGAVWTKIVDLWNNIVGVFNQLVDGASRSLIQVKNFVLGFFSNAAGWLMQAGRNIIDGLINGVRSKFTSLWNVMKEGASIIAGFWPFSPAKHGPLSGSGDPMKSGQRIVTRLAAGMEMEAPRLQDASTTAMSNITFGPNSIQMRFSGIPTPEQAMAAGGAVGQGIYTNLARDTRLAVRTL